MEKSNWGGKRERPADTLKNRVKVQIVLDADLKNRLRSLSADEYNALLRQHLPPATTDN